ncbi:hypothetical protein G4B88_001375 [Cannabis sativa]|uniref:DUF4283 domain-containing protein n=1 Tax=Cannabis sativa TaxID=3483 RepID=A0A7J6F7C4_CANSA|nr:hypothetical protein G4B88_001375 [Cannabis sativa]
MNPVEMKGHYLPNTLVLFINFPISYHLMQCHTQPRILEAIIATNPLKGKFFTCLETTVSLTPSESSLKALSTLGLFGKVVAPMIVDENALVDFVGKTWKKKVSVVAMEDLERISDCFEFGFEAVEDRDWVLQNGPWCFRGYTIVLKEWSPKTAGLIVFKWLRTWLQIHNLPHEYFSCANGNLLGSLAEKVVKVDIEDDKPFTWSKVLRVLMDIDFEKPLVSSCFFNLANGVKQWLQFKYEKVGIFYYKCGTLGHQRRGCSISSPVMIVNRDDKPFPMFGSWLSPSSANGDVFTSLKSEMVRGVQARSQGIKARAPPPLQAVDGIEGERLKPLGPSNAWQFRNPLKTTARPFDATRTEEIVQAVWLPRPPSKAPAQALATSGNKGDKGQVFGEKDSATKSVLALEGRSTSIVETSLNLEKEALNVVGGGPYDIGLSTLGGPAVGSSDAMGPHGLICFPSAKDNSCGGLLQTNKDSILSGFVDKAHSTTILGQREPTEADNNKMIKVDGLGPCKIVMRKVLWLIFFEAQENYFMILLNILGN